MEKICISSSLRFKETIRDTVQRFTEIGIDALFPNLDTEFQKGKFDIDVLRGLCQDHFTAINAAEGLYVINPGGYIGTLVTVEIGYALGREKPVYFTEPTGHLDHDVLFNGIIPLDKIETFHSL
ncbi:MAG: hypothetical protein GY796_26690 [Chloroflexi bacterium]|nr:hypothetical protein [Chloroflexota bacterium]